MTYQKQTWNNYNDSLSVEQNKANKALVTAEGLNHIETGIEQVEFSLSQQLADKVGGGKLVAMGDLSNEIKESLTGGSVAVVGKNSVTQENLTDNSVDVTEVKFIKHTVLSTNLADVENRIEGGYYEYNTGKWIERLRYNSLPRIRVYPNEVLYRSFDAGQIAYYDKAMNHVAGDNTTGNIKTVASNEDIYWGVFAISNAYLANAYVVRGSEPVEFEPYKEKFSFTFDTDTDKKVKDLKGLVPLKRENLLLQYPTIEGGYYQWDTGVFSTSTAFNSTPLIPAKAGDSFRSFFNGDSVGGNVTFWDKSGMIYLSGIDIRVNNTGFEIPENDEIGGFRMSARKREVVNWKLVRGRQELNSEGIDKYKVEVDFEAPNILKNTNDIEEVKKIIGNQGLYTLIKSFTFNDNYSVNEYRGVDTTFWTVHISQVKFDGTKQVPKVRMTSSGVDSPLNTSVENYMESHIPKVVINAGIFNTSTNIADDSIIIDGEVIQDKASTTHRYQHKLAVLSDGTLKSYSDTATTSQMLTDGVKQAVVGFIPILEDHEVKSETFLQICPHSRIKNPRQIIGQYDNGDYIILSCDGRRSGEAGLILSEAATILKNMGVKFAYNLDGGGSTQTFVGKKRINRLLENRKVPTVIVFGE